VVLEKDGDQTTRARNEKVLLRVKEDRNVLHRVDRRRDGAEGKTGNKT
jgi:hypothetical protein